ncbi:MAG: hypothetical protein IIU65_00340 [Clostridia bacterium]|nr:hypothetical protein [Clostridia bacterium]
MSNNVNKNVSKETNAKHESFWNKLMFTVFGLLIVAFVLFHTFSSLFSNPYETDVASEIVVKQTISADCIIVRKENIITSDETGYKVCKVSNGGKVAKYSPVVSFYENASDVEIANEINILEEFLSSIEEIDKQNSIHIADLDIISEQTGNYVRDLLVNVDDNDFAQAQNTLKNLRYYMAQGQLATGREENYSAVINNLKKELNTLKSKYQSSEKSVQSEYSGYFVNFVDGYENAINYDAVEDITVDQIENLKSGEVSNNQIGRVISENEWYIITTVNTTDIKGVSIGDKLKISTSLSTVDELSVTVSAINKSEDGKKAALVLSCMKMNEELSTLRQKEMQIVLKTYKGLKVNSRAVRIKDGKKGVYVQLGSVIKFIETDIIYNTKDYVVVESKYRDGELKIYDDVIVKGKDLDGQL